MEVELQITTYLCFVLALSLSRSMSFTRCMIYYYLQYLLVSKKRPKGQSWAMMTLNLVHHAMSQNGDDTPHVQKKTHPIEAYLHF